jgi:hypothetical protein
VSPACDPIPARGAGAWIRVVPGWVLVRVLLVGFW